MYVYAPEKLNGFYSYSNSNLISCINNLGRKWILLATKGGVTWMARVLLAKETSIEIVFYGART
jgi:hypothetical protein